MEVLVFLVREQRTALLTFFDPLQGESRRLPNI